MGHRPVGGDRAAAGERLRSAQSGPRSAAAARCAAATSARSHAQEGFHRRSNPTDAAKDKRARSGAASSFEGYGLSDVPTGLAISG
jgi:hypothetical protein